MVRDGTAGGWGALVVGLTGRRSAGGPRHQRVKIAESAGCRW